MIKFYYKIDYTYDENEDFVIISSSDQLSINQITDFVLGNRDSDLFEAKEIWELDYTEGEKIIPFSLKEQLL